MRVHKKSRHEISNPSSGHGLGLFAAKRTASRDPLHWSGSEMWRDLRCAACHFAVENLKKQESRMEETNNAENTHRSASRRPTRPARTPITSLTDHYNLYYH